MIKEEKQNKKMEIFDNSKSPTFRIKKEDSLELAISKMLEFIDQVYGISIRSITEATKVQPINVKKN